MVLDLCFKWFRTHPLLFKQICVWTSDIDLDPNKIIGIQILITKKRKILIQWHLLFVIQYLRNQRWALLFFLHNHPFMILLMSRKMDNSPKPYNFCFFSANLGLVLLIYLYNIHRAICRPLWGGPGPRFEPWTGGSSGRDTKD